MIIKLLVNTVVFSFFKVEFTLLISFLGYSFLCSFFYILCEEDLLWIIYWIY